MSRLHPPVSARDHSQGPDDAPVTLVEYGDYQCPVCGEAYPAIKQVQQQFEGKLRFVFRNFPIPELHPQAVSAAMTAEYCGSKDKFWPAHDALYENQSELGPQLYQELVEELGLSVEGLDEALQSNEFADRIQADIDSGLRSGVNGTPSFYINGEKFEIEQSFAELSEGIAKALGQ